MPPIPDPLEPVEHLRRIPIRECGEPLVDFVTLCPELIWVERHPVFACERRRLLRLGVAERLCRAARSLPPGLRLAVVEGWRAPAIQEAMYRATCDRLRAAHPDWSEDRLRREVDRFSAPTDPAAPPPHTTGAAVDVHLVDDRGKVIDMISPYDLMDMRAAPRDAEGLTEQARANRLLLRAAMEGAGLTNYPAEWWHWTFGDQSWAYRGGHPEARYGAVVPPGYVDAPVDFSVHPDPGL